MSNELKDNSAENEMQNFNGDENVKINYTDFLKDAEEIEKEIAKEEELKRQKIKEKFKKPGFIKNKKSDDDQVSNDEDDIKEEDEKDIDLENSELKRAEIIKERVILTAFGFFAVIAVYLLISFVYYNNRFLPSTVINGEDCSGKTVEEVSDIMKEKMDDYQLKIVYNDITIDELYGSDINLSFGDMGVVLDDICDNQNKIMWLKRLIFDSESISTSEGFYYDTNILNQFINSSLVLSMTSTIESENAGLEYVDGEYQIKPAVYGDEINKTAFINKIIDSVNSLNTSIDINRDECFVMPELTEDNKTLIKSCKEANKLIENKIELNVTDDLFEIPVDIKKDWLTVDNTGELIFDTEAFSKYMDRIDRSYSCSDDEREFKTYHGDTVTVTGGDIDTGVNRTKLTEDMSIAMLNQRDSIVVVDFISYENTEIGNSYIEIDLSNQMLWMFINGEQIVAAPVITGSDDGEHNTPEGVYRLKSKTQDTTITENGETKEVAYYMSVNGDVGICDASWKSLFGGSAYMNDGSDGCVYVLEESAKEIYENCYENMPVIMYHHEIIESYFIEDSYMGELMELIENRPEIPTYEEDSEETSEDSEEGTEDESVTEDTEDEMEDVTESNQSDNSSENVSSDHESIEENGGHDTESTVNDSNDITNNSSENVISEESSSDYTDGDAQS